MALKLYTIKTQNVYHKIYICGVQVIFHHISRIKQYSAFMACVVAPIYGTFDRKRANSTQIYKMFIHILI